MNAATLIQYKNYAQLDDWATVLVSGKDAIGFLHGQLSNDIQNAKPYEWTTAGYCDPKGRLLAILYVVKTENNVTLVLPKSIAEKTLARLKMFVMRSDVTFSQDNSQKLIGLQLKQDSHNGQAAKPAQDWLISSPFNNAFSYAVCSEEMLSDLPESIDKASAAQFQRLRVEAGLPTLVPETIGSFVPQWINLDLVNGINYKKGCYPGQEIVARTHYLGKLKKRMYLLSTNNDVAANENLYVEGNSQSIGQIVDFASLESGKIIVLAMLRIDAAISTDEILSGEKHFQREVLPYTVDQASVKDS